MFKFAHPEFLYGLILIPLILGLFLLARYQRRKYLKMFGDLLIVSKLMPEVSKFRPLVKLIFTLVGISGIIFALSGPQFGSKLEKVKREGIELIIALDVSNSMLAQDIKPCRLESAKRAISKLVEKLGNDKIGIVVFAGDAYVQLPVTTDYGAAKLFLNTVNTSFIPKQGTAIGSAIEMAMGMFSKDKNKSKAIIVISDGENHEDDAIKAATAAAQEGVVIHTIGMGSAQGAPIPFGAETKADFKKDESGSVVITRLNDVMLQQISTAASGVYVKATSSSTGLDKIYEEINKMQKELIESKTYSDYEDRYQYILALVLLILLIEPVILERKNRILSKINWFNTKKI